MVPAGGLKVQYQNLAGSRSYTLTNTASGAVVGSGRYDTQYDLPAGDFRLEYANQSTGTYSFRIDLL